MQITVRITDDQLHRFQNMASALGEQKARVAFARAINRTTNSVHGKVIRAVAKHTSIPTAIVRRSVKKRLAAHQGSGPLEGVISATGRPLSLKHFRARQFSWGTRAKVWGELRRFEGSFIFGGTWRSGRPAFEGHVMTRVGRASFPVRRENGPAVPQGLVAGEAATAFTTTVAQMLPNRVMHELSRLLGV